MAVPDIDFEGQGGQGTTAPPADTTSTEGNVVNNQDDQTALDGGGTPDVTGKDGNNQNPPQDNQQQNDSTTQQTNDNNNPSTGELNAGDTIDVDGTIYTVAENGDLVDDKGNVFKEAKDIPEWLKSVQIEDNNGSNSDLNLAAIQEAVGITITDENGKDIEFTNDAVGVKAYIDEVINLRSNDLQQAAINRLYQDNPLLKQFQDYVQLNGTPRGFGEIPDRSNIQLDKDNEAQLVAVIKMAATEFGNKSLNDNYIKYLKDSGGLYDEARQQLAALVEKDTNYRKDLETRAKEQRDAEMKAAADYWNNVNKVIENRIIGGYRIPESFTKEVNGQKIVITPNDFFNYISKPQQDEEGNYQTGYQRDLAKLSDEQYLNREILDAWLMYTGGTYKDLIDMAVREEQVRQLRVKSNNQRSTRTVKVIKKNAGKSSIDDIVL